MPNFYDKEKYVIHYENLQLQLRVRLKLKKVHRVLEFNQPQWLKPCIESNTKKNKSKKIMKKMENRTYGKTMENLRNRTNVKLVNNKNDYLKWTTKLSYIVAKNIRHEFSCDT